MGQSNSVPLVGGISYEAFCVYAASIKIPAHIVDVKATFDRYKDPNSDLISSETIVEMTLKTDVFLTHDWGIDELGRVNHDRVAAINKELKSLGFVTWFDSERMTGEVVYQMANGINHTSVVIVFITQRYMNKVNGPDANDNCRKEFNFAVQKKSSTKMIPVVMEPRMKNIRGSWDGVVQLELGNILYVDFSNDNDFQSAIQQLKAEILSRTNPLWVLRSTPLPEITTPPPPPVIPSTSSTPNDTDRQMIDQLSSWFGSIHISSSVARRYAELLVEKNSGSITKLQRKLERNVNYLEEIGGFDEDDIIDIKEGLKLLSLPQVLENNNNNKMGGGDNSLSVPPSSSEEILEKQGLKEVTVIDSAVPVNAGTGVEHRARFSSENHSDTVLSLSWYLVGNKIASGSGENTIKIWDGKSLELLKTLEGHSSWVYSVSWNHDGSQIVSGSGDSTIKIWDGSSGRELYTLEGHSDDVFSVAWNHDSRKIVSGSYDETIKIWAWMNATGGSLGTWELLKTLKGHSDSVQSVSWNHDGSQIVSGSADRTIKIWDSSTGTVLRTLTGHSSVVYSVSFSHDGSKIVSGSDDKTVRIWNAITGDLMKTLEGHSEGVTCVAWSPDDQKIASCSPGENKIIIWDALTVWEMNSIQSVKEVGCSVAWNHDGSELVCEDDKKICVFSFGK
jgi:WD40 repeat protein